MVGFVFSVLVSAAEFHGVVTFGGLAIPGATVTATQGDQKLSAVTDQMGVYSFPDLKDGAWSLDVAMPGFAPSHTDVAVAAGTPAPQIDLKLLSFEDIVGHSAPPPPTPPTPAATTSKTTSKKQQNAKAATPPASGGFQRAAVNTNNNTALPAAPAPSAAADAVPRNSNNPDGAGDLAERASDGLLINGSVNNGAASAFAQSNAFGNNRRGPGSLYNGLIGMIFDTSSLDARAFSITGQDVPKPQTDNLTGVFQLGGPLRIPKLLPNNGPTFFIGYQWTRNRSAITVPALVPTEDQRAGILGNGITIPTSLISPQALALLQYYPHSNFTSNIYNYEAPIVNSTNKDALQSRLSKQFGPRTQVFGTFNFQRVAASTPSVFNFLDTSRTFGINSDINVQRRIGSRFFAHLKFQYSYQSFRTTPYFANRENVSGEAGITGNSQAPADWGPPTLSFQTGIYSLTDGISSFNRNQTGKWTFDAAWYRTRHNITFGTDYGRQEFNYLGQGNPRGAFTFTGAVTGNAFGDFLEGVPDVSQVEFGNADKYFRDNIWDAFIQDDWRVNQSLTINSGVRWEYGSPISELDSRLVNLAIGPGWSSATPWLGNSTMKPDRHDIGPRIGIAWRPFPASSMVVRAGYGVYYNTSVYQSIAIQMAQQSPLAKSVNAANSATDPLTLANGFTPSSAISPDVFAVDPNYRVGYSQNWQASVQRDLPGSLVATITYAGIKGTRGQQEFLPNTYPTGAVNPCPSCPSGFAYMATNGNSTRESGQAQLRRRLKNGLTATIQYTYSKSIDDSTLGGRGLSGNLVAQNWLDLAAERALSSFDQRHVGNVTVQYTTGMGLGGGTLLSGWRGALYKEWTFVVSFGGGTGLPLTPQILNPVAGTGVSGPLRPDYNGGSPISASSYSLPLPGQWGTAGRDSITGPSQTDVNASLARTFRLKDRLNLDLRFDSTNALNHVSWVVWNTTYGSPQFGQPNNAAAMRDITTTLRLRF